jgi:hypothetical protein
MNAFFGKRGSKGKKKSPSGSTSTEGPQPSATGREQSTTEQQMVSHLLSLKSVRKAKVSNQACSKFVSMATELLGVLQDSGKSKEYALNQVVQCASQIMFYKKTLPDDVKGRCLEMVNRAYVNTYVTKPKKKTIPRRESELIRTSDEKAESLQSKFVAKLQSIQSKFDAKLPGNPSKEQKQIVEQSLGQLIQWRDLNVKQSQAEEGTLIFVRDKIGKSDVTDKELNSYCNSMVSEVYAQAPSQQELQDSAKEVTKVLDKKEMEIQNKKEMEIQISTKMVKRGVEAGVRQAIQEAREKKTAQVEADETAAKKAADEEEAEKQEGQAANKSAEETAKQASMPPSTQDITDEQIFKKRNADLLASLGIDQSGSEIVNKKDGGSNQPKTPPAKKTTFMSRLANWWSWLRGSFLSLIGKSENDKATDSRPIYDEKQPGEERKVPDLSANSTTMAERTHKGVDKEAGAVDVKKVGKGTAKSAGKDTNDDGHKPTGRGEAEENNDGDNDADNDHPAPR